MKKISWRLKLVSLFVGVLCLTLILQIFYVNPYIHNQEIRTVKLDQEEITQNIVRELDVGLNRLIDRLQRMSMFPEFRNMNIDGMEKAIKQYERISERIPTIAVINSEGCFVSGSMEDLSLFTTKSYADRPYFTIPFNEGKTYFAPPRYYPKENIIAASICVPIESESGDRVGVLIGGMDLNDIIKRVSDYPLAEGQVICITDKEGTVIANSDIDLFTLPDGPLSLNQSEGHMTQAIIEGEKDWSQEYKSEEVHYFGTHKFLKSNGWGVAVTATMESVLAGSKTMLRNILFIDILIFIIALIITIIFSRQVTAAQMKAEKEVKGKTIELEKQFKKSEEQRIAILSVLSDLNENEKKLLLEINERKQAEERLKKTMDATIDTMSNIIEAKDPYTSGHQHRVCQLAVPLARELGLTEDKVEGVRIASLIHDIGKIGLPTEILSKPGKLTDIEFSLIKDHSRVGHDILKSIDFSYPIANIVLQHHERLDGSGYPNKLKGDEILLEAKILGVADVVEAMSSFRPYRPAKGIDAALGEISQNRGILYDPEVVDACLKLFKEKRFKFE